MSAAGVLGPAGALPLDSRPCGPHLGSTRRRAALASFLELTKPRLTGLVALTAAAGFSAGGGAGRPWEMAAAVAGTTLLAAGSSALNQVMEREADGRMERTRHRPLPAGRLHQTQGIVFGAGLLGAGTVLLLARTNELTAALGLLAAATYLAAYTPLKRVTPLCTLVGAVPGALPPAMGWAAATGRLDPGAWALFTLLFLWQVPHFLAIAWMRREDYTRAGFSVLTVGDTGGSTTARAAVLYCLALLPVGLLPQMLGVAGPWYGHIALAAGLGYLGTALRLARLRTRAAARVLFLTSLGYLPLVLAALIASRAGP